MGGRGGAISRRCLRTVEKVWKSFWREGKRIANRRLLGRAKCPAVVRGWLHEVAPSMCRAVWLSPIAVSSLGIGMEKTGLIEANLESLRGREAEKRGLWQERD